MEKEEQGWKQKDDIVFEKVEKIWDWCIWLLFFFGNGGASMLGTKNVRLGTGT